MTKDIVQRLNNDAEFYSELGDMEVSKNCFDAAAEIERLRAALRCAHQAADDVYKRLMPEIARKDAALQQIEENEDQFSMQWAAQIARAALAPAQEKTSD